MKEVAPPGWGHTKADKAKGTKVGGSAHAFDKDLKSGKFKGLPGDKTMKDKKASMFKLMWAMKKKGAKPHYKPGEKDVKKESVELPTKSQTDAAMKAYTKRRNAEIKRQKLAKVFKQH